MTDHPLRIARRAMFAPVLLLAAVSSAQEKTAHEATWSEAQQRGCDFLATKQEKGVFSVQMGQRSFPDAGFTSLAIAALQSKPVAQRSEAEQAVIDQGLRWVLTQQNDDGSFGRNVPNYTTCAVVMALGRWQHAEEAKAAMQKAQKYVLGIQKTEATGTKPGDQEYGGIGYGSRGERADLSNMQFSIAALRTTGLGVDDEAFRRAQVFLQRVQNVKKGNDLDGKLTIDAGSGEHGKLSVGDDGGAVYYPGESPAGYVVHPDNSVTPRSYGSMTYALLKTYTLCGVDAEDPRVQAAVRWIGEHWTVTENPGADPKADEKTRYQGLFYYYMLMAQALDAVGIDAIDKPATTASKAAKIDWRKALREQVEKIQRDDGSWLNEQNGRWYENLDILCTCYALLALEHC
ncbi:MAG: terpene cyclase/mutase family protein [Planctomycetes bacterium]|nr:terpene cyclase/mutase family protein [Planctomycetota bacterium]